MDEKIQIVSENRKARHEYEVVKTYEAGIQLMGSEVKSIRDKQIQLKDSYVTFRGHEAFLQSVHVAEHKPSSYNNHAPERLRKLLMHRHELDQINEAMTEKGLSCVPLKVYFKNGRVKIELAVVRGRKSHDKRQAIKTRDANLELKRVFQKTRSR